MRKLFCFTIVLLLGSLLLSCSKDEDVENLKPAFRQQKTAVFKFLNTKSSIDTIIVPKGNVVNEYGDPSNPKPPRDIR